ncbi:hypothetical protein Tco_0541003 [Tanacetum coccineum]
MDHEVLDLVVGYDLDSFGLEYGLSIKTRTWIVCQFILFKASMGLTWFQAASQNNINKQTVLTSTALKVNTVKPSVNDEVLGHVNLKNFNSLSEGKPCKGFPSKLFQIDHTCVCLSERKANTKLLVRQFEIQKVWMIVDLPLWKEGYWYIRWVYRNKKDERRMVVRNKLDLLLRDTDKRMGESHITGGCQFLGQRTHLYMAMQIANHCSYFYKRSRYVVDCKLLWQVMESTSVLMLCGYINPLLDLRRIRSSLIRSFGAAIIPSRVQSANWNVFFEIRSPKPIRIHFNRPITHAISSTDILDLQALISRTDDHSLRSNMAALESCPKHNMIAYLENKMKGETVEFHDVIFFFYGSSLFLRRSMHITAKVAGKLVSISEASIRTDLLFDDANGIDTLPNQAIFDAIQLMGYEGDLTKRVRLLKDYLKLTQHPLMNHTSEAPYESMNDSSSDQSSEWNLGDHSFNDKSLSGNEDEWTLQKVVVLVALCVNRHSEENIKGQSTSKESFSLKKKKKNAQSEGRTKVMMDEVQRNDEVGLVMEGLNTDEQMESIDDQVDALKMIFEGTERPMGSIGMRTVESTADKKMNKIEFWSSQPMNGKIYQLEVEQFTGGLRRKDNGIGIDFDLSRRYLTDFESLKNKTDGCEKGLIDG